MNDEKALDSFHLKHLHKIIAVHIEQRRKMKKNYEVTQTFSNHKKYHFIKLSSSVNKVDNCHNTEQIYRKSKEIIRKIRPKTNRISTRPEKLEGKSNIQEWM